jgi:predicted dehydrogenase
MRIAVIGCGGVAARCLPWLRQIAGAEEIGLCDQREEKARTLAARHGLTRTWKDAGELLAELRPEVVHLLTPPQTHRALAVAAMGPVATCWWRSRWR